MNMGLKPALKYELRSMLLSSVSFFAVITVVVLVSVLLSGRVNSEISFNGYCVASAICLFVFGVVEPRACMRLCAQLGVSRRSAFLSNLAAAAATALALAIAGELLLALGRLMSGNRLFIADLYQLIYLGDWGNVSAALTFPQHIISILFNLFMMLTAYCGGMFFTYLFWRLNKLWTVIAAISIPVLLNLVPMLIYRSEAAARITGEFFGWMLSSAWNMMSIFVLLSLISTLICYLLIRRVNIKAPTVR